MTARVLETGLFLGMASCVIVAGPGRVEVLNDAQDDPRREILRRKTPAGGRNISVGVERAVDNRRAGLDDPFPRIQVGACRTAVQQPELGENQRA